MSLQIETAQNVGLDYEVASVGERIIAYFIDGGVKIGWVLAIGGVGYWLFSDVGSVSSVWLIIGGLLIPILLYSLLCEYFMDGRTVGKMAMRIKVVRLDGSKATFGGYLIRWLLSIVDINMFSGLVALLTIVINGKGQRLGDIAAGTTVVRDYHTVKLADIALPVLPEGYRPTYPGVTQLSDSDIRTLRKVLLQHNPDHYESAANRVAQVLGVTFEETPYNFLVDVVNDYQYYAEQDLR